MAGAGYRATLLLFPREFRRRYAAEMTASLHQHLERARRRGRVAAIATWMRAVADVPGSAWRTRHLDPGGVDSRSLRPPGRVVESPARPLGALLDDVRHARRALLASPGFTASSLAVLILGIGGSVAVFSVLNAVLLRPLPYPEPERLAMVWTINTRQNLPDGSAYLNVQDWLARGRAFEDLTMVSRPEFTYTTLTTEHGPERLHVGVVAANFFPVLGLEPLLGRNFTRAEEMVPEPLALIGHDFWQRRFGGADDVLGKTLVLDGTARQIVGVVPADVGLPYTDTEVWALHDPGADFMDVPTNRRFDGHLVIGRLRSGVGVAEAQAELDDIAAQLAREFPDTNEHFGVRVRSLHAEVTGQDLPRVLWMLFAAVIAVLAIACGNVAHLLLTRGAQRQGELAVRSALGAGRGRVVRQLLVESVCLSLAGGVGGLVAGVLGLRLLLELAPAGVPRLDQVGVDLTVVALAVALAALCGPLFGLLPAILGSSTSPGAVLRRGARGSTRGNRRLRQLLVVAEITMAVVLLAGAGLLARSLLAASTIDPGYRADRVLVFSMYLDGAKYGEDRSTDTFYTELVDRIRGLPGVEGAGVISDFFINRYPDQRIRTEDGRQFADGEYPRLTTDEVLPGFLEALELPLLDGRRFTAQDVGRNDVFVVNATMAAAFWPGESAVGKRFQWDSRSDKLWKTVVGVVGDSRRMRLEEAPFPFMYVPGSALSMDVAVRTFGNPLQVLAPVRELVRGIDPTVPLANVSTAAESYGQGMSGRRFQTWLLGLFSGLAVLLAAVGIYGLLHDLVVSSRREIGIRMALGADPGDLRRMILRQGFGLAALGLGGGIAAAAALADAVRSQLYGVDPGDPFTLLGVGLLLVVVAATASWIPARRATRVDPVESLSAD